MLIIALKEWDYGKLKLDDESRKKAISVPKSKGKQNTTVRR